jgi:hypothetical protein
MQQQNRLCAGFLSQPIQMLNTIIECLARMFQSRIVVLENVVVKDGEVYCQRKSRGMCGRHFRVVGSKMRCHHVRFERLFGIIPSFDLDGKFGQVSVKVSDPSEDWAVNTSTARENSSHFPEKHQRLA